MVGIPTETAPARSALWSPPNPTRSTARKAARSGRGPARAAPLGIVGTHAGDLISEVCLAVEMGCEPADIGKTIHPHLTLGESIGMTAEVFEGHCTDPPPQTKK
jgi:Pyridine nucleotide-disulphide oxidoreductase, dimerisation domain